MAKQKEIASRPDIPFQLSIDLQAPDLFAIPRPYEDDYERNAAWYVRMHRLENRLKSLRKNYNHLLERHEMLHLRTRQAIDSSLNLIHRFQKKRIDRNMI